MILSKNFIIQTAFRMMAERGRFVSYDLDDGAFICTGIQNHYRFFRNASDVKECLIGLFEAVEAKKPRTIG